MSRRLREDGIGGAAGRVSLAEARRLNPRRTIVMAKMDGALVRIVCDSTGRARHFFFRSGAPVPDGLTRGIKGELAGYPHAELIAELECLTERSMRAVEARRGVRLAHVFDLAHTGTRSLRSEPFHLRRRLLMEMRVDIELGSPGRSWIREGSGRARSRRDGRFAAQRAEGWRSLPILDTYPLAKLDEVYNELVECDGQEGLVLCNTEAPLVTASGRAPRGGKLKCKPAPETIDAVCLGADETGSTLRVRGSEQLVYLGPRQTVPVVVGGYYELAHEGRLAGGSYRFLRVSRARPDLSIYPDGNQLETNRA